MRRRAFIVGLGAAVAWPLAARTQQGERTRRVGVLMLYAEDDREGQRRAAAFRTALEKAGWTIGRNLAIDYQWGVGDAAWIRSAAAELLRGGAEVIVANGGSALRPVQQAARDTAIVFVGTADPVAEGFVQSLAHPGRNMTGFTVLEPTVGAKLLQLLKAVAPQLIGATVLYNPDNFGSLRLVETAIAAGQRIPVEMATAPVRGPEEIEKAIARLGARPAHGLIVLPDPSTNTHRKLIIELAARDRVPAIYALRDAAADGGLMSYGISIPDLFRQAGQYVDRILKGEKPADLPVQQPTKFEMVINLNTARALGLTVPQTLLVVAEVIE